MMVDAAALLGIVSTAYLAFACFALSQRRHWEAVTEGRAYPALVGRILRPLGAMLLALGLALAIMRDGLDYGAVLWVVVLSFAALSVALTLTWRPRALCFVSAPFRQ
jgi:Protein of unknown function (DUF3325)